MDTISAHVGHEREVPHDAWDGIVAWRTLLSADRTPSAGLTLGTVEIEPGASSDGALHHHAAHEAYYFLAGRGMVHLDGADHPVEAGSVVFVPGGAPHFVRNTGDAVLRFVFVFAVDRFDDVEYVFAD